jgi:hypothetical protein
MSELFNIDRSVINKHINNIFESGELERSSTCAKFAQLQKEGNRNVKRDVDFYNLDMIISVGYRVSSTRGTQFRIWATQRLKEYLIKGFTMNDERLSGGRSDYFDELVRRVRAIRVSEKNFYQQVKDVFSTSIDYDNDDETAKSFYATVQNKFHFAPLYTIHEAIRMSLHHFE